MGETALVLLVLAAALLLFASELIRLDVAGLGIMLSLVALGLLRPEQAFAGFANPALLTVAAMFVISAGLNRTGAVAFVATRIIHHSHGGQKRLLLLLMLTAALMSAFINNTTVVVIFIPVVIALAQEFNTSPSRLLLPLSYASIFGGTCTLIGTSTNLLVSDLAAKHGQETFGMFELAPMGLICVVVGTTYMMTIGRKLLPDRRPVSAAMAGETRHEYLTEVQVRRGSSLVGKTIGTSILDHHPDLVVLQIVRGEQIIWPPLDRAVIQPDDVLMIRGDVQTLVTVHGEGMVEILPELARGQIRFDPTAATLAEVVILPNSPLVGVRVGDARFRRLYGVTVMALQRRGAHFREKITQMDLRPGDILLVYGDEGAVDGLKGVDEFIVLERPRPIHAQRSRTVWALAILGGVVLLASLGITSIFMAAMGGALLMVLSGCLRAQDAYLAMPAPWPWGSPSRRRARRSCWRGISSNTREPTVPMPFWPRSTCSPCSPPSCCPTTPPPSSSFPSPSQRRRRWAWIRGRSSWPRPSRPRRPFPPPSAIRPTRWSTAPVATGSSIFCAWDCPSTSPSAPSRSWSSR